MPAIYAAPAPQAHEKEVIAGATGTHHLQQRILDSSAKALRGAPDCCGFTPHLKPYEQPKGTATIVVEESVRKCAAAKVYTHIYKNVATKLVLSESRARSRS